MSIRQIILDTETTGLEPSQGHRIIEIGCVEMINRRVTGNHYHQYLQPDREIDQGAIDVHGITNEFLSDMPRFEDVADDFLDFVKGAELVIHNAPFDVGFIEHELARIKKKPGKIDQYCTVLDTLTLARQIHPGQRNSLDALCKRYGIDNSQRDKHGALLDSEILADVYLVMTGGQTSLSLSGKSEAGQNQDTGIRRLKAERLPLKVMQANQAELEAHNEYLEVLDKASDGKVVWKKTLPDV